MAALILVYPLVLDGVVSRLGARTTALALLGVALLSLALPDPPALGASRLPRWPRLAIAALLGLAAITTQRLYLLLIPALVYLGLAAFLWASLRGGDSVIHQLVRRALPEAPGFIASYCHRLTGLWAAFFAVCSLWIAALALGGDLRSWESWTGWGLYAVILALSGIEFLVRKSWFRYYFRGGPFDRFWSRLFPAEGTPRGRRSAEAIRQHREQLGSRS